jgi:hypothetical protein
MATLREAGKITDELQEVANRLHDELTDGDVDFRALTELADKLGEGADGIASTFAQMNQILSERLLGDESGQEQADNRRKEASGRTSQRRNRKDEATGDEEPTREDLLERAKEAGIPGRSSMSKDDLQAALDDAEGMSKEELLEQARKLDIPGRSSMTKDQLQEALRAEERVSKEELLERAREADLPGRSEMSKDELREALRQT